MARQFKPVRFFVMMAVAAFIVCGAVAFYTKRAEHGRTSEERAGYFVGEKAGEEAAPSDKLPNAADLNMMAQEYFKKQGLAAGVQESWDLAFEHGYEDGFKKPILRREIPVSLVALPRPSDSLLSPERLRLVRQRQH